MNIRYCVIMYICGMHVYLSICIVPLFEVELNSCFFSAMTSADKDFSASVVDMESNLNQRNTIPDCLQNTSTFTCMLTTTFKNTDVNVNIALGDANPTDSSLIQTPSKKRMKKERKLQKRQKMHAEWK